MADPTAPTTYGTGQYVASEAHYAALPRAWKASSTKRCALVVPGWSGSALSIKANLLNANITQLLAAQGVPSFSGDYGTGATAGKTWGNDTSQLRLGSMFTYAGTTWGAKTDKFLIWGGSMGTLQALNYAIANPTKVAAIALLLPAVDLDDLYTTHASAVTTYIGTDADTNIQAAYGGSDGTYQAAKAAHNPNTTANRASFAAASIPCQAWYSTDDPLISTSTVTAWATAVGATATSMGATGGHAASSALITDPSPITTWLAQYA